MPRYVLKTIKHDWNNGNFLLVSDCCLKENMGPPAIVPSILCDKEGYINTMNEIVRLKEKYNAKVVFCHDIRQFNEFHQRTYWD